MTESPIVPARTQRVVLPGGHWVEVKACLNHGEHQEMYEALYVENAEGQVMKQPFKMAEAVVLAYLVDWSYVDLDGQPLTLRGKSRDERHQILKNFYQDYYLDVKDAVDAHHAAVTRERAQKKRLRSGGDASPMTLPSPADAVGAMNG
jgi:hypothetical protein